MDNEKKWVSSIRKGPCAANAYLYINDIQVGHLVLDWSYDGVYFKYYNDTWITLSIGPETKKHEINLINTEYKIRFFKYLASQFFDKLQNYSEKSNESLLELKTLVDIL